MSFSVPPDGISNIDRRKSSILHPHRHQSTTSHRASVSHVVATDKLPSKSTVIEAEAATAREHDLSIWQAVKAYRKAIGWSLLFSSAIIMEGYDLTIMGSFFISPVFVEQFGIVQADGTKWIPATWQSALGIAMQCGQIIGLFLTGILADRFGYKKVMAGSLIWLIGVVFILFFAKNLITLLVGEMLMGFPLGVFQTLTVTYASEVCPAVLRCYLTTYVNLCWVFGQLIASGITKAMFETRHDEWLWRIPFSLQWAFPIPILIGVILAPESPWWLVRVERLEDAKKSIARLACKNSGTNADDTIAMMIHTNEMEKEINEGTTYLDCFRGVDLRRTEITCVTWACQSLCGSGLMGASSYFYFAAGLDPSNAYSMALGQYILGAVGVFISWVAMSYMGRRTLYVWGLAALCFLMLVVGGISLAPGATNHENPNIGASWATGSMLLVFTFIYDATVGPVCYSLVSEIPSTRLRTKTVALARNCYNICGVALGFLIPYMLNPKEWNLMGRSGFIWAGTCFCCLTWAYFRLPEPKGRTFAELDVLFERKISARKFKKTDVDLFGAQGEDSNVQEVVVEPKH